jgi:hypothetical protein
LFAAELGAGKGNRSQHSGVARRDHCVLILDLYAFDSSTVCIILVVSRGIEDMENAEDADGEWI